MHKLINIPALVLFQQHSVTASPLAHGHPLDQRGNSAQYPQRMNFSNDGTSPPLTAAIKTARDIREKTCVHLHSYFHISVSTSCILIKYDYRDTAMPALALQQQSAWENNVYVLTTTRLFVIVGVTYLFRSLYQWARPVVDRFPRANLIPWAIGNTASSHYLYLVLTSTTLPSLPLHLLPLLTPSSLSLSSSSPPPPAIAA